MISKSLVETAKRHSQDALNRYALRVSDSQLLSPDDTFGDAAAKLHRVLFVVDEAKHVKGVVTPSDVETAKRKGLDPKANVLNVASRNVVVLRESNTLAQALSVFAGSNPLHQSVGVIPILADDSKALRGYITVEQFIRQLEVKAQ